MTLGTRWPEAHARRGLVATPQRLASEAGLAVLRRGGNAVDAAIAATTISVVYPHMNGVGGDSVWLIDEGRRGELVGLNAAGRSAAGVDADWYRARYGVTMPTRGGAAALTVPGAVSGWWEAHRFSRDRRGSQLAWGPLLADAIAHARDGTPHDVRVVDAWSDLRGHAQMIRVDDGELRSGSDPRADDAAVG